VPAGLVVALELGVCCSWLASATASVHAASRLVYSLGVERLLPARLARVHARFRTPHAAIGTIVAAVAAGALVLATGELLDDVVRHVVRAMVVAAYALVAAASVRFMLRIREQTVPVLVAGVLGAGAGVGLLGYLVVAVVLDGRIGTAAVIVGLLAAGPLWQRYLRRRPARLDAVGAFDCAESADVLPGAGTFAADAAGNVVLVDRDPDHELTSEAAIRTHLHASAIGKLLLAQRPELAPASLRAVTARTITRPDALTAELTTIRARDVAREVDELRWGRSALAVPMRDPGRAVIGCLVAIGRTGRIGVDDADLVRLLRGYAERAVSPG
jgi:hypothetical protein